MVSTQTSEYLAKRLRRSAALNNGTTDKLSQMKDQE